MRMCLDELSDGKRYIEEKYNKAVLWYGLDKLGVESSGKYAKGSDTKFTNTLDINNLGFFSL